MELRIVWPCEQKGRPWRKHEEQASPKAPPSPAGDVVWREVQAILDEEIARLPELYRQPFILCCLENKGRAEVARQLGVKEATVWSRLAHARKLLQQRLGRRGVSLSAVLGALALLENTARGMVSSFLVSSTVKAALAFGAGNVPAAGVVSAQVVALVNGGLKTMFVNKLKIATAVLLGLGICGFSATVLTYRVLASQEVNAKQYRSQTSSLNPREKEASPLNQQDKEARTSSHDFTNLQRLASALKDYNYPENVAASITIWIQAGGKGVSATVDEKTLDLIKALSAHGDKWEGFDLENVAVIRADGKTIQFVNVKDKVASGKPSGFTLNRGDLVVVLKAREN